MRWTFGVVAGLMAISIGPVKAQTQGDVAVRISGRMQFQFNSTSVTEEDIGPPGATSAQLANSTFETRRVRLGVQLRIGDWITGVIEPEYALARLQLRQAWMNLAFDPAFQLRFGQYKKPFSLINLTSSLETAAIERGQRIRGLADYLALADAGPSPVLSEFDGTTLVGEAYDLLDVLGYLGYELGASVLGEVGRFSYHLGVFNGTGADTRDNNDGKSYAGRLVWQAPVSVPVAIGAAASYHEIELSPTAPIADGTAYSLDFELGEFKRSGLHVLAEVVAGDNMAVGEELLGAQAMLSFYRPVTHPRLDGVEPLTRVSWADPNRAVDGDEGVLFTPGINVYFAGRNRLMLNWDVYIPAGERFESKHALRAQAQLAW